MSLWTPYAEAALDLSKTTVKAERSSPAFEPRNDAYYPPSPIEEPPSYYGARLPYQYTVPVAQISPLSVCSSSSRYEDFNRPRPAPSPPASPESFDSKSFRRSFEMDSLADDPDFQVFERNALRAMAEKNGGSLLGNNPRMRRAVRPTNQNPADVSYRKQRARNNFAAKQSRDRRKLREIHLALEVTYLRNIVAKLKTSVASSLCPKCQHQCQC